MKTSYYRRGRGGPPLRQLWLLVTLSAASPQIDTSTSPAPIQANFDFRCWNDVFGCCVCDPGHQGLGDVVVVPVHDETTCRRAQSALRLCWGLFGSAALLVWLLNIWRNGRHVFGYWFVAGERSVGAAALLRLHTTSWVEGVLSLATTACHLTWVGPDTAVWARRLELSALGCWVVACTAAVVFFARALRRPRQSIPLLVCVGLVVTSSGFWTLALVVWPQLHSGASLSLLGLWAGLLTPLFYCARVIHNKLSRLLRWRVVSPALQRATRSWQREECTSRLATERMSLARRDLVVVKCVVLVVGVGVEGLLLTSAAFPVVAAYKAYTHPLVVGLGSRAILLLFLWYFRVPSSDTPDVQLSEAGHSSDHVLSFQSDGGSDGERHDAVSVCAAPALVHLAGTSASSAGAAPIKRESWAKTTVSVAPEHPPSR